MIRMVALWHIRCNSPDDKQKKNRGSTKNKVHILTALGYFWWAIE